jgi:hypothetical protein
MSGFEDLRNSVERFKTSSSFTSGDPTAFAIPLLPDELELPGPNSPKTYMAQLEHKLGVMLAPKSAVAVICPGSGGLCAQVLHQGANRIVAIEPRYRYADAIETVISLLRQVAPDRDLSTFRGWPVPKHRDQLGLFDLILWPEGLEEATAPLSVLTAALLCLKPTGSLIVEVVHGEQGLPTQPINSWRPSEPGWQQAVASIPAARLAGETLGRSQLRKIYRLDPVATIQKEEIAVPAKPQFELPPFPRDIAPAIVYSTARAEPLPAPPSPPPSPQERAPAPTEGGTLVKKTKVHRRVVKDK